MKLTQCTELHLTTLWYNELDSKTLQSSKQFSAVQCNAVQCRQRSIMQCSAVQTAQCNVMQCSADSAV